MALAPTQHSSRASKARRALRARLRALLPFGRKNRRTRRSSRKIDPAPSASIAAASEANVPEIGDDPSLLAVAAASPRADAGEPAGRQPMDPAARGRLIRAIVATLTMSAVAAASVAALFFGHRFLTGSPHFAIREIQFSSTTHVSSEVLRLRSGIVLGENLFRVDLAQAARSLRADPWIAEAKAWRELPATIVFQVVEREPVALAALGSLYLVDAGGEVFKRATPDETAGLAVVTGVTRDGYVQDRDSAQALLREGFAVLSAWRSQRRVPIGEVHVDAAAGTTLYTLREGIGIRVGRAEAPTLDARLAHVDRVLAALQQSGERPELLLVDEEAHADRVTVRLAQR